MKILIVYATYSSGTEIASKALQESLKKNHEVVLQNVTDTKPYQFKEFDFIFLASPSWDYDGLEGQPHQDFVDFMESTKNITVENKPFAVFGLGDSSYAVFCGAVDHLENFVKNLKGKLVTPSFRIDGFYFHQEKSVTQLLSWGQSAISSV